MKMYEIKVNKIHPRGTMNVCSKFHGNLLKVLYRLANVFTWKTFEGNTIVQRYLNLVCFSSRVSFIHFLILSFQDQAWDGGHPAEEDSGRWGQGPRAANGRHETKTQSGIWRAQWAAGTGQKGNEWGGQKRWLSLLNKHLTNTSNVCHSCRTRCQWRKQSRP